MGDHAEHVVKVVLGRERIDGHGDAEAQALGHLGDQLPVIGRDFKEIGAAVQVKNPLRDTLCGAISSWKPPARRMSMESRAAIAAGGSWLWRLRAWAIQRCRFSGLAKAFLRLCLSTMAT